METKLALTKEIEAHIKLQQLKNQPPKTFKRVYKKISRNDACPCNSGKKYKKCCLTTKK